MSASPACNRCGAPLSSADRYCARCGADVSGAQAAVKTEMVTTPVPPASQSGVQEAALLESLRQATMGDYEVLAELGRGGMATVYLAHDLALSRKVAIKVMSPALQYTEGMAERFKREARTSASLSHPNIIPIYAVRQSDQVTYFVMKFIEGRSLDSIIKEIGPLPIPMVQAIANQVGSALGHAHKRGIVHRDVKPANIMVDSDGWAVVTDFGIAKVAETRGLTMTGATVGTPSYMSPEQCAAGELTGASDQYSLGVVIYEMLAGRTLFDGDSALAVMYAHLHQPPPPLGDLRREVPAGLAAAVMRMLEKDPAKRWPSMEAVVVAVGGAPLAPDDPIRTKLVTLAATGAASQLLKRVSTPVSAPPASRREAAKTTPITGLAVHPVRVAVALGGSVQFTATVKVPGGTTQPGSGVTWASTDTSVVTISDSGLATGVGEGTATVTGSLGKTSATAIIQVTGAARRRGKVWAVGLSLAALGVAFVAWLNLSKPAPAPTVVQSAPPPVVAATPAPESVKAKTPAEPAPEPPPAVVVAERVEITPGRARIELGGTFALHGVAKDRAGKVVRRPLSWATSDESVARVSSDGMVTAVGAGTATITATADRARSAPVQATVVAPAPPKPTGTAVLQVVIVPVWGYVSIDGNPRGQLTRFADTLSAGVPHHLYVQRDGFATIDTSLTLDPNEQRLVRIQMKRR